MRARLLVEATAHELAAACEEGRGALDVTVVEVAPRDGGAAVGVQVIAPLSRMVSDPPGGPGAAARVYLTAPREEPDGRRR